MGKKMKDIDYLVVSARIRAKENSLLTQERMEQVLAARSDEEAAKLLREYGYPALNAGDPAALDAALSRVLEETLADLADSAPDPRYIELFKLKYDYHNIKAVIKAEAMGTDPGRMLMDLGRVPAGDLREALQTGSLESLPPLLGQAAVEAKEVLATTRDPQLSDVEVDRWCYRDMAAVAEESGSAFLRGYVETEIDAVNLRTLVRALRMGKNEEFLKGVVLEGGSVDTASILSVCAGKGSGLSELYGPTCFREAAESGAAALKGGGLTEFEKLCDDAVGEYLSEGRYVPFGEAALVGYLAARETEYTNLRILLMGRGAGLAPEIIRSRLRKSYV